MYELIVPLDEAGNKPLYEQIYEYIKDQIKLGNLPAKTRLPSTRKLAEHLGVSRSTTQMAYDQLISEGYLEAVSRKGYFVSELDMLYDIAGGKAEGNPVAANEGCSWFYDFSPRGIDLESFPYGIWRKLSKNILNGDNKELFSAGENKGDLRLRQAICTYLYGARGVNCHPEQLIVGAGNEYLLMLLNQILGNQNIIAMETPTYRQAYRVFERLGHRIIPVEMDGGGMNVKKLLASDADIAYVMPSHQFPTGIVMPIRRRIELLLWASEKENRYIIEDDYDSEFRYRGKPIPSLQSADRRGRVIYLGTFSRAVAPAIRVSYMMLPEPLMEIYERTCSFYSSTVSRIDQRILAEFIEGGYYERHLNKMRSIYKAKHDALLEALEPLSRDFSISGEYAGIHILLTGSHNLSEKKMVRAAQTAGVRVYGLSEFDIGEEEKKTDSATVLLGYANLSREEIVKGAGILCRVMMN